MHGEPVSISACIAVDEIPQSLPRSLELGVAPRWQVLADMLTSRLAKPGEAWRRAELLKCWY